MCFMSLCANLLKVHLCFQYLFRYLSLSLRSLSLCVSLCLSVYLSICVYVSICLCLYFSFFPALSFSFSLSISIFFFFQFSLSSVRPSVCLSISLSVFICLFPSLSPSFIPSLSICSYFISFSFPLPTSLLPSLFLSFSSVCLPLSLSMSLSLPLSLFPGDDSSLFMTVLEIHVVSPLTHLPPCVTLAPLPIFNSWDVVGRWVDYGRTAAAIPSSTSSTGHGGRLASVRSVLASPGTALIDRRTVQMIYRHP